MGLCLGRVAWSWAAGWLGPRPRWRRGGASRPAGPRGFIGKEGREVGRHCRLGQGKVRLGQQGEKGMERKREIRPKREKGVFHYIT